MRPVFIAAASVAALSAAACAPHPNPALRTRLDCPQRQGVLVRASVSADGKTCGYRAGDVDVTLQLTPVTGDPTSTLNAVETALVGPKVTPASTAGAAAAPPASAPSTKAPPEPSPATDAAKAAQEAREDADRQAGSDADWDSGGKHSVVIDRNGSHVATSGDDNDHAHIDLPGVHIDADHDNAQVDVAGVHIDAAGDQATIRAYRDVRLEGEGLSRERNGVRATFIARREDLPDGYRFVGYEASGPKTGPLTIATVRSRNDMDNHGRLYHDIRRLVRRNGGA